MTAVDVDALAKLREAGLPSTFPVELFWSRVNETESCWLWTGYQRNGYGHFMHGRKDYRAHRVAWVLASAQAIPGDLVLDHLCRVRNCVNPAHLEPVSTKENVLRGVGWTAANARKTHCPQGHEYTPENTKIDVRGGSRLRSCRACRNARHREWKRSLRTLLAAVDDGEQP